MRPVAPTETVYLRTGTVRLTERQGEFGSGTLGYVIGKFARETPTFLVSFGNAGVIEVRGDKIVSAAA